jgi:hypothetical protein
MKPSDNPSVADREIVLHETRGQPKALKSAALEELREPSSLVGEDRCLEE